MLKIAIVEDNKEFSSMMHEYVGRYMNANGITFQDDRFYDGMDFVTGYKDDYDIVFMDIEMPLMSGMDAAKQLRQIGSTAKLIFVTNMAQYAINGYEVDAVGFLVKPITYFGLEEVLKRALDSINRHKSDNVKVIINAKNNVMIIPASTIIYVEVQGHDLIFHTDRGDVKCHKTLKEIVSILEPANFAMCSSYALVNLRCVSAMNTDTITVGEYQLPVSRRKKKELWEKFMEYTR